MTARSAARLATATATLLALAACGTTAPTPRWQATAHASAQRATEAWLVGDARTEAAEYTRAHRALASTARPDLVIQLQLLRCATRTAALTAQGGTDTRLADHPGAHKASTHKASTQRPEQPDPAPCGSLPEATPEQHAYARYLAGRSTTADAPLLPPPHRPLAAGSTAPDAALAAISDPLSRLVAAGVLLRRGQATPGVIAQAVATASAQGWRRPLQAWLQLQKTQAQAQGATAEATRLQRRLDLLAQP